jgi:hypothetical protein
MKTAFVTLLLVITYTFAFGQSESQTMLNHYRKFDDSTLVKIVKGIDLSIKERYKKAMGTHYLEAMWRSQVTIISGKRVKAVLPIDSLQGRYHILDTENITVDFNESSAFYGIRASLGVIKVFMKDDKEKQKK